MVWRSEVLYLTRTEKPYSHEVNVSPANASPFRQILLCGKYGRIEVRIEKSIKQSMASRGRQVAVRLE